MIRHPSTVGRLGKLYSTLFMRRQLRDPEVRRKAWPDYTFGCKRILFSSHYLPALERDNVELVTDRVTAIEPDGVRTDDGRHHPADVLIWGTGFKTTEFMFPMDVVGRDGRTLQEEWSDGAHAHLGMTVPGFPSLFVLYGPNTNTSGGSIIVFLEAQVAYVRQALEETARRRAAALEVRRDVEQAFDRRLQAEFEGTAWTQCDSWYRDESGRIVANWPNYMEQYVRAVAPHRPGRVRLHLAVARDSELSTGSVHTGDELHACDYAARIRPVSRVGRMVRRSEIELKTSGEVDAMREAGRVVARCLDAVRAAATVGTSLKELDGVAHDVMTDAGAVPAFLDYHPHFAPSPFPGVICASVNDAVVHAIPGSHRLAEGDLLSVDCGAFLDGWCGDAAISLVVGARPGPGRPRAHRHHRAAPCRPGSTPRCRAGSSATWAPRSARWPARPATGCSPTTAATASGAPCTRRRTCRTRAAPGGACGCARAWSSRSSRCCTPVAGTTTSTTRTGGPCGPPTAAGRRTWSTPSRSPTTARGS